jgi:Domain of unknown function (DUF6249)
LNLFKPARNPYDRSRRVPVAFSLDESFLRDFATARQSLLSYRLQGENPGEEEEMGKALEMLATFDNPQVIAILIPIVAIVATFTFVIVVHWVDSQRKEREAYYKAETLRRITEASGEGAKAALELLHENELLKRVKAREGLKITGLVNLAAGVGVMIFLHELLKGTAIYLCGLIPALIGVGFLAYVFLLAGPLE